MKNNKILAWFSCGITSAVACKLAIEKYGKNNVDLVYINIDSAHKDNDRFIKDCPNCGSEAVGYDGTGSVPFLECFQCDHNWIP